MRALFRVIAVTLSISVFSLSAVGEQSSLIPTEKKLWKDQHIALTLDQLKISGSYPSEFTMPGYRYPPPKEGYQFVVIFITLTDIKDVHLGMPEPSAPTNPTLEDAQGKGYELTNVQYTGVDFKAGLTGSDSEIVPGAKGVFLFETPKNAQLKVFRFVYPYWKSWEAKAIKYGQIEVMTN